ncbi:MAG: TonB family protein, partial [Myxococcales bacterium]|nr:TonB family protein [Myxococcales bacterium]
MLTFLYGFYRRSALADRKEPFRVRHITRFRALGLLSALLLAAPAFAAEGEVDEPPGKSATLTPPRLLKTIDVPYPAEAIRLEIAGDVVLRLILDERGHVEGAEVVSGPGHGLDEAARTAALSFEFAPAERDGKPIRAIIEYTHSFALPDPAPVPPTPAKDGEPPSDRAKAPAAKSVQPPAVEPPRTEEEVSEVRVSGVRESQRLRDSSDAVKVVEVSRAKQRTSDLGEVLARTEGVAVRRQGGLGSSVRFSLNGLYDDQIRLFLDGVPLERAGYPFGIANVPVNLLERVEIYRGVVPLRLGADALGGAVNLVTDRRPRTRFGGSYQVGSFGTYRGTLSGRYYEPSSGIVAAASAFMDLAKNDYAVDAQVPDERGRLRLQRVRRFHDAYSARGAMVEAGVAERRWAKLLTLQLYGSSYDKEIQHNAVMSVPYGEVNYDQRVRGATLRYAVEPTKQLSLEVLLNYAYQATHFEDRGSWVYDWFGRRIRERRVAGEVGTQPSDQLEWQHAWFARLLAEVVIAKGHTLRIGTSPSLALREGDERLQADPAARDPLNAERTLVALVSGVEYQIDTLGDRLENVVFLKDYIYHADTIEPLPAGRSAERRADDHSLGFGDALRFRVAPWLIAKASYEYATRLPRPDEVFGDGVLVLPNLELEPERSHNANIGPSIELKRSALGDVTF